MNGTDEKYWTLGGDLRVARMGFGAMRLPVSTLGGPANDRETGLAVLRRAVELGVDHIDTAAFYYHGDLSANDMIREALSPYPDGLVIATKVGPHKGPGDLAPTGQLETGELRAEVERNLRELGRDTLDLVYLRHGGLEPPGEESIAERFAVLAGLREEGIIRHLGVSHVSAAQLDEARAIAPVAAVQNWFDVTRPQDTAMLALCAREGIAYVPFFPLGGFGIPDDPRLKEIAGRHGATVPQILLAGLLALSPATLAIPGTGSLDHLEENVAATGVRLTDEDLAAIDEIAAGPDTP
ncbi:aldo/keto reductase [Actinomadura viridis]|uniref:Aryl-alcohol dehydrogenase-like predicted oxidoreductase n=1 Tax=Actinomadura viridis TaxID=58110 RepID=A0A931GSJ3_9ACTN|nr:oxidoreductase [Actinomadura viridis]MBG6090874.1 aryl-alcohol dehydrogenase-like predicted oxidoreductase [Actinomadura viridis]